MHKPPFESFRESKSDYRFRLVSGIGEVVVARGPCPTKVDAKLGIKAVVRAGLDSGVADQTGEDCYARCTPSACKPTGGHEQRV